MRYYNRDIIEELSNSNDYNDYSYIDSPKSNLPDSCKTCMNHPVNGGSGICLCTLGLSKITC